MMEFAAAAAAVAAPSGRRLVSSPTNVLLGDLRTGRIHTTLPAGNGAWTKIVDEPGTWSNVQVPLFDPRVRQALGSLYTLAAPGRAFCGFERAGRVLAAGPVWVHRAPDDTKILTMSGAGLWSLFDHRFIIPVLAASDPAANPPAKAVTNVSGTDLGGIAATLVAQAMAHVGGDLPIVLPPVPTGTRQETFAGYDLPVLGQQLRQLTQRETAAPNIRFSPRRRTDDPRFLQWVMEVGTEAAPQLVQRGEDHVFDTRLGDVKLSVQIDAQRLAERAWTTGRGQGESRPIVTQTDPTLLDAGWPLLEARQSRDADNAAALTSPNAAFLVRFGRPAAAWQITYPGDAYPRVVDLDEGDWARVIVKDHWYLPDGEFRSRILSIAGGLGPLVTVTLSPIDAPV